MPQYQQGGYRNYAYNTLGTANPEEDLSIQTESQGFHEIRVYNGVRDLMWSLLGNLILTDSNVEAMAHVKELKVVLMRADSVWWGIFESTKVKAQHLKAGKTSSFVYKGEMEKQAKEVQRYLDFFDSPEEFMNQKTGLVDPEYETFAGKGEKGKLTFLKDKMATIVTKTDSIWGELAAKLGLGMPLKIAEERDFFSW
jgi:hypothetical protein